MATPYITLKSDKSWDYTLPVPPPIIKRDPTKQPGLEYSIWNLPVGTPTLTGPVLTKALDMAMFVDTDLIFLRPTAPLTAILEMLEYPNDDGWGSSNRNTGKPGVTIYSVPLPATFNYLGSHQGNPDGDTPNACAAFLAQDGHTLIQTQPFCRWPAGNPPTSIYRFPTEDIRGTMETGSHGGSLLSAIGGTIRLGEWIPGGRIPHAIKLNLDEINYSMASGGFRWPARKADRPGGAGYGGTIPECRMGSLLTLPPLTDAQIASALKTEEVRILARCCRDYGAYICDSAGWRVYGVLVERSPDGSVRDEFQRVWGHPLDVPAYAGTPYSEDLHTLFTSLRVVDSWDFATWQRVSASKGAEGAGGGAPRTPWAAPLA